MKDMNVNIEIEFKSLINKEKYDTLLKTFNLENNIFKHTNYYFDTKNQDLNKQKIVLRIRHREKGSYKLTLKSQSDYESYEYHVFLEEETALKIIKDGFNTKEYFEQINYDVLFVASLDNYRSKTPYEEGTLFIDYCEYCGNTDYEIEYEVNHYEKGLNAWELLIKKYDIKVLPLKRKSERALTCIID